MRKQIGALITAIDSLKPNPYTNDQKLEWLDEVEGRIIAEVVKMYEKQVITVTSDILTYNLNSGYNSMDIVDVFFDKKTVSRTDIRELYDAYITDNTTYTDANTNNSTLVFQTGKNVEVIIIYQKKHVPYMVAGWTVSSQYYLLVESPYSQIYMAYVEAKIDWYKKNYEGYNNNMAMFSEVFEAFTKWYRDHSPVNSNATAKNLW